QNGDRLHRQRIRNDGDLAGHISSIEIAAVHGSCSHCSVRKTRRGKDEIAELPGVAAAHKTDLVSTSEVRFAFTEPGKLPCKTDGRTEIVPVIRVNGFIRLLCVWANEFERRDEIEINGIVGTHPAIKASSRNPKQRKAAPVYRYDGESLSFVWHAVPLVTQSQVERQ